MRGRKYTSQNREKYGTLERNQTAAERAAENKSEKNIRGMKMDGKNREEQENGAKVRDLEEYKAENRKRKRRRRITVGILAGAILAAGIGTGVWLQLRTFQGYDTVQATETEDTDTYMFQKSGNKIVRYRRHRTARPEKSDPLERSLYHGKSADDILRRCNCHLR